MASFDYAPLRLTADRLIKKFGATATLRRGVNTGTAYNPTQTVTEAVFAAVEVPVSLQGKEDRSQAGSLVKEGDRIMYLSAQGQTVVPQPADIIDWQGGAYSIVAVKPLSPAGITVFYEVAVTR